MDMVCLDLEGVLIPEVWVAFAEKTGIHYDELLLVANELCTNNLLKIIDEERK